MFSRPKRPPQVDTFTGNIDETSVGAIRWDAWYHPTVDTVRGAVETSLGPNKYHHRLPFFGSETSTDTVSISGTQSDMDAEIAYAVASGVDYWAFVWYGASNSMMQAWTYFQASPNKLDINWCMIYAGYTTLVADVTNNLSAHVSYMQQANYQKVLSGRPLIFVLDDGSSQTGFTTAVADLRAAAITAGLPNPYIVFMHGGMPTSTHVAQIATFGMDAISKYTWGPTVTYPLPFEKLDAAVRTLWGEYTKLSVECVPTGVVGWDRRPRVDNPVPWEGGGGTLNDYYYPKRMSDISRHTDNLLKWVRDNPTKAVANTCLLYSWNEFDEGGWICPTKTSTGVNDSVVNALRSILVEYTDPIDDTSYIGAYISQGVI